MLGIAYVVLSVVGLICSGKMYFDYRNDMYYAVVAGNLDVSMFIILRQRISRSMIFSFLSSIMLIGSTAMVVAPVPLRRKYLVILGLAIPLSLDAFMVFTLIDDFNVRNAGK